MFMVWLTTGSHIIAQTATSPEEFVNIGNSCESNIARLDTVDSEAGEDRLIIVIARLGNGERSRSFNHRRLHNLRTYLRVVRGRAAESIVTAEGARARGRGRLEIYVGGRLIDVLGVGRGEDLSVGSCAATSPSDRLFYDSRNRNGRGAYIPSRHRP